MNDPGTTRLLVLAAAIALVGGLFLFGAYAFARRKTRAFTKVDRLVAIASSVAVVVGLLSFGWSFIEADWLSETHLEVRTKKLPTGMKVRVVHLSDLHVDQSRPLFSRTVERVNALKPDLLVFTGDSLNAAEGFEPFRAVLSGINAPMGRYAVRGNHDVNLWHAFDLFGGGVATELRGQPIELDAAPIAICGTPYSDEVELLDCVKAADPSSFMIAAYHTPDLVERTAPDLYLAGHTHGGQVRTPLYGALVTLSRFDKKYEMGRYDVGPTTLFVSRGVGVEPHAPRIRFLCRPEIAVIDLVGE